MGKNEFTESEHPRSGDGQFRDKPTPTASAATISSLQSQANACCYGNEDDSSDPDNGPSSLSMDVRYTHGALAEHMDRSLPDGWQTKPGAVVINRCALEAVRDVHDRELATELRQLEDCALGDERNHDLHEAAVDLASIRSRLCSHVDLALACGAPGSNNVQVPRRVVHGMQGALTELGFLPARLKSLS